MKWNIWRLVITISVIQVFRTTSNDFLNHEQVVVTYLTTIIDTYFETRKPIVIVNLVPNITNVTTRTLHTDNHVYQDISLLQEIFKQIHNKLSWQIIVYNEIKDVTNEDIVLHCGYIFYFGFHEEESELVDTLYDQIENLKRSKSWNARGKFIIYLSTPNTQTQKTLAQNMCEMLWEEANIANVLIIIAKANTAPQTNRTETSMFNTYTWFPYERISENKTVTLNDCVFDTESICNMFPSKVPQNFWGLSFKVGTLGPEPYVIKKNNASEQEESAGLQVEGIAVHLLNIIARKINATLVFNEPYSVLSGENTITLFGELVSGTNDILAGVIPDVAPICAFSDPSIRVIYDTGKWLVPCPNPIHRVQRITTMFNVSVWVTIGLVFVVTSLITWYQARRNNSTERESSAYRHSPESFQNLWAVLIGISVPQLPTTNVIRVVFITFVVYSLAITTIFQAFFTTFLIEPGYEKGFDSIESVINSKLPYGQISYGDEAMQFIIYEVLDQFRDRKIYCPDLVYCVEKVLFEKKWATLINQYFPYYLTRRRGIAKESKVVCFLDEIFLSTGLSLAVRKGNPLLAVFNKYLYWGIEGGLLEEYWSRLKHEVNLKAKIEEEGDTYFVFSMTHLSPIFIVLLIGCCFSAIVFVAEILTNCITKRFIPP
jgi:Ligand-gated ion channel.